MTICNSSELLSRIQRQVDSVSAVDITWSFISSGSGYSSASIKTDGTLWTWGFNSGSLGDGTFSTDRCSPGTVAGGGITWKKVAMGSSPVAIKTDGTLWQWGTIQTGESTGQLFSSPISSFGGGTTWCDVSSSLSNRAAIKTDGTLWTWGSAGGGQLGDGTTTWRSSPGTVAGGGTTWCQVSLSCCFAAAIKTDGTIWTWGVNSYGRLGDGTTVARCSPGTVAAGGTTWCQVSGACDHTLAIKTDGTLWTWGSNSVGTLGDGTTLTKSSPGTVAGGGTTWCDVSGARFFSTAVKTDGTLWTWGYNAQGRLGEGTIVNRCSPGTVAGGGTTWCQVSSGKENISAIKTDGTLWTWGRNDQGRLGDGTTVSRCSPGSIPIQLAASPEDLTLLSAAVAKATTNRQVSVASSNELPDLYDNKISNGQIIFVESINAPVVANNECWIGLDGRVLRSDAPTRTLFTWGFNNNGQLGDGTTVSRCSPGTVAGGGTTWCQVSGGYFHIVSVKTDGTLWTWGSNNNGQLGEGTTVARSSPGTVAGGGTTWCQVFGGNSSSAAIKTDGTLWTWGQNIQGRLGDGTALNRSSPGTVAGGGTNWCSIFINQASTAAAIKTDGTLWTWGSNVQGILGDGTVVARCSPGTVAGGGTTWCQVAGGRYHTAAIKTDGTLWTWGCNFQGQLGDGTLVSRCSPGTVAGGGTTWCKTNGTVDSSVAIKTDGTLWTWGGNIFGVLGDGTTVSRCSPGTIADGSTTWCQVFSGTRQVLAIKTDGTIWTWGYNTSGRLGDGTTVNRCSPVTVAGGGNNWIAGSDGNQIPIAIQVQ